MAQGQSQPASPCAYNDFSSIQPMNFTRNELDAILALIEYHTHEGWYEMIEITGLDAGLCCDLYNKLTELRDKVA